MTALLVVLAAIVAAGICVALIDRRIRKSGERLADEIFSAQAGRYYCAVPGCSAWIVKEYALTSGWTVENGYHICPKPPAPQHRGRAS